MLPVWGCCEYTSCQYSWTWLLVGIITNFSWISLRSVISGSWNICMFHLHIYGRFSEYQFTLLPAKGRSLRSTLLSIIGIVIPLKVSLYWVKVSRYGLNLCFPCEDIALTTCHTLIGSLDIVSVVWFCVTNFFKLKCSKQLF